MENKKFGKIFFVLGFILLVTGVIASISFSYAESDNPGSSSITIQSDDQSTPGSYILKKTASLVEGEPGVAKIDLDFSSVAAEEDEYMDLVLILDRTGSMVTTTDNFTPLKKASADLIKKVSSNPKNRVAVITFVRESSTNDNYIDYSEIMSGGFLNKGNNGAAIDNLVEQISGFPVYEVNGDNVCTDLTGLYTNGYDDECTDIENANKNKYLLPSYAKFNATSYADPLQKLSELLRDDEYYKKTDHKRIVNGKTAKLKVIFLTDGENNLSNDHKHSIAYKKVDKTGTLDKTYGNGIGGSKVLSLISIKYGEDFDVTPPDTLAAISDDSVYSSVADISSIYAKTLNLYTKLNIYDMISSDFSIVEGSFQNDVGSYTIEYGDTITWNLDNIPFGTTAKFSFKIKLRDDISTVGPINTNSGTDISGNYFENGVEKEISKSTTSSPSLTFFYNVTYKNNHPTQSSCGFDNDVVEPKLVYSDVSLKSVPDTCGGYVFKGWVSKDVNNGEIIKNATFKMPLKDITFEAVWEKGKLVYSGIDFDKSCNGILDESDFESFIKTDYLEIGSSVDIYFPKLTDAAVSSGKNRAILKRTLYIWNSQKDTPDEWYPNQSDNSTFFIRKSMGDYLEARALVSCKAKYDVTFSLEDDVKPSGYDILPYSDVFYEGERIKLDLWNSDSISDNNGDKYIFRWTSLDVDIDGVTNTYPIVDNMYVTVNNNKYKIFELVDDNYYFTNKNIVSLVGNGPYEIKGKFTKNDGEVVVNKIIYNDNIYSYHGTPVFIFKLVGVDVIGNEHVYYKTILFDSDYGNIICQTTGSCKIKAVSFSKLPYGTYTLSMIGVNRYKTGSLYDNKNGLNPSLTKQFEINSGRTSYTYYSLATKKDATRLSHNAYYTTSAV